jgi:hypothetical protein
VADNSFKEFVPDQLGAPPEKPGLHLRKRHVNVPENSQLPTHPILSHEKPVQDHHA